MSRAASLPENIGAVLRAGRLAQGLTLDQVALLSDVPPRHLASVEAGELRQFATPLYATAYARAYAAALGISEAWVDRQLRIEMRDASCTGIDEEARLANSRIAAKRFRMIVGGVIGAACVTLFLMVG